MRDRSSNRTGFTLVEVVVVMVLIAIVSTVVVPAFFKSAVVDPTSQAAQPIVQLLKFGKQTAAESGVQVRVVLDPATGAYSVTRPDIDTAIASGVLEMPVAARLITDSLRARFVFDPTGLTYADSILVASSEGSMLVRVNRWTGTVNAVRW